MIGQAYSVIHFYLQVLVASSTQFRNVIRVKTVPDVV